LTTALHADDGMSVEEHFRRFASSLELTDEETRKAATIQNQIREVLEARQDILRAELSGSYDRKTKIRPLHDIDILVVFDPGVAYNGRGTMIKPRQFLSEIGKSVPALRKKIPRVGNSRFQERSLNIAVDGIGFDLVPAFELQRGGYFISNRKQQEWIPTNPLKFAERLTALNQSDYFGERLGSVYQDGKIVGQAKCTGAEVIPDRSSHFEVHAWDRIILGCLRDLLLSRFERDLGFGL
jgi:predicted nucleotidyltransferase